MLRCLSSGNTEMDLTLKCVNIQFAREFTRVFLDVSVSKALRLRSAKKASTLYTILQPGLKSFSNPFFKNAFLPFPFSLHDISLNLRLGASVFQSQSKRLLIWKQNTYESVRVINHVADMCCSLFNQ